jgi:GAF domain-containing protein
MIRSVLCVDAADDASATVEAVEAEETLTAVEATSVAEARERLDERSFDCVVTAYDLPDGGGLDVVAAIRDDQPQTPCVLFTDVPPSEIDTASFEEVIVEYLSRDLPDAHDRLGFVVDDVIAHSAQVGFLTPENEQGRLEALAAYDVDELPIEDSFDRLTDLIASHFDVGVAFVGLLEKDEENFLACTGADWDSLTREDTICTHSMLQEDVMVVEDIRADARFRENETLEGLGIVSYAGANMTTPDGQVIGQVCVIDYEPRGFSEAERAELQQFAETAMEILELRKTVREARERETEAEV